MQAVDLQRAEATITPSHRPATAGVFRRYPQLDHLACDSRRLDRRMVAGEPNVLAHPLTSSAAERCASGDRIAGEMVSCG